MLIKIRQGIFETNSSSSHSFSMPDKTINVNQIIPLDDYIELTLGIGEFGWGYESYHGWMTKADYLGVEADEREQEMIIKAIKTKYPKAKIKFKQTGYIDHQSSGHVWSQLTNVNEVFTFIFSPHAVLYIDNDNN